MGELDSHGLISKELPSPDKNDPKVSQKNLGGGLPSGWVGT